MKNTVIIIPTRLEAKRFPNKPLAKINNVPMIIHVLNRAKESKVGEVYVATPDQKIFDIVKSNGGNAILTQYDHPSGSDRVYEAYSKKIKENVDLIVNLQGDMPNIKPNNISKLEKFMRNNHCDIGTLASPIKEKNEIMDPNVVKVEAHEILKDDSFSLAKDFFRKKNDFTKDKVYHHLGLYIFTRDALTRYVKLRRSKLEIERNLEQMRAMENNMQIKIGLTNNMPLSVDTEEDLLKIKEKMEK
jgi:3-deoxy-D-manno-octulosonate cytidylyltransferase|tara:strand:+ start:108 stop:842 length:735 start_codon:yes stop_codon:yes gene_type:complete